MLVQSSVVINRPIDEVFAYVADYRNDAAWRSEVRELRYVSDEPVAVGIHALETAVLVGRRTVTESVITVYEPNRRVDFDSVSGPFRVRGSRTFETVEGGTRVTSELEWRPTSRIGRLLGPAMQRAYQRTLDRNLVSLRTILEQSPQGELGRGLLGS